MAVNQDSKNKRLNQRAVNGMTRTKRPSVSEAFLNAAKNLSNSSRNSRKDKKKKSQHRRQDSQDFKTFGSGLRQIIEKVKSITNEISNFTPELGVNLNQLVRATAKDKLTANKKWMKDTDNQRQLAGLDFFLQEIGNSKIEITKEYLNDDLNQDNSIFNQLNALLSNSGFQSLISSLIFYKKNNIFSSGSVDTNINRQIEALLAYVRSINVPESVKTLLDEKGLFGITMFTDNLKKWDKEVTQGFNKFFMVDFPYKDITDENTKKPLQKQFVAVSEVLTTINLIALDIDAALVEYRVNAHSKTINEEHKHIYKMLGVLKLYVNEYMDELNEVMNQCKNAYDNECDALEFVTQWSHKLAEKINSYKLERLLLGLDQLIANANEIKELPNSLVALSGSAVRLPTLVGGMLQEAVGKFEEASIDISEIKQANVHLSNAQKLLKTSADFINSGQLNMSDYNKYNKFYNSNQEVSEKMFIQTENSRFEFSKEHYSAVNILRKADGYFQSLVNHYKDEIVAVGEESFVSLNSQDEALEIYNDYFNEIKKLKTINPSIIQQLASLTGGKGKIVTKEKIDFRGRMYVGALNIAKSIGLQRFFNINERLNSYAKKDERSVEFMQTLLRRHLEKSSNEKNLATRYLYQMLENAVNKAIFCEGVEKEASQNYIVHACSECAEIDKYVKPKINQISINNIELNSKCESLINEINVTKDENIATPEDDENLKNLALGDTGTGIGTQARPVIHTNGISRSSRGVITPNNETKRRNRVFRF